eukprot:gene4677-5843_t
MSISVNSIIGCVSKILSVDVNLVDDKFKKIDPKSAEYSVLLSSLEDELHIELSTYNMVGFNINCNEDFHKTGTIQLSTKILFEGVPPDTNEDISNLNDKENGNISIRGSIWKLFLDENSLDFSLEEYLKLSNTPNPNLDTYISKDVPRTFKDVEVFNKLTEGPTKLTRVLNAFSNQYQTIGYKSGMSFIVATFLCVLPEFYAYLLFRKLITKICPFYFDLKRQQEVFDFETKINNTTTSNKTLIERINDGEFMKIQAPMVRFSRLPFRMLCKRWGCDITYTPMILAAEFNRSEHARDSDFTTNQFDNPNIVQFAANDAEELVAATEKVAKHCQGIDINCGCPQKWVMKEGYGANLLLHPEKILDMVKQVNRRTNVPCSIKIRIQPDLQQTIQLAKNAEAIGVHWITVHGRTSSQRSSHPVDFDAIKLVKENIHTIPVFANGDVFSLDDANQIKEKTGVNGVMSARGLLTNPALFLGYKQTPFECVQDFINIYSQYGDLHPVIFHRHLMYMLYDYHNKNEKVEFNSIKSVSAIIDYINDKHLFNYNNNNL